MHAVARRALRCQEGIAVCVVAGWSRTRSSSTHRRRRRREQPARVISPIGHRGLEPNRVGGKEQDPCRVPAHVRTEEGSRGNVLALLGG